MEEIYNDFPILSTKVYGHPLVYLDNAATTQMPMPVLEKLNIHYKTLNSNVFRGNYYLSQKSTQNMEKCREHIATFIQSKCKEEIVFTQNATDSINLVAWGLRNYIKENDEIIVSELEHHSNFVPWQQLCKEKKATLHVIPIRNGKLDMKAYQKLLNNHVKFVAVTEVSNLTGEVTDVQEIIKSAHQYNALVLIDGAQGIRHSKHSVYNMDCDFYCFSAHKLFGPSGVGVLYGKKQYLDLLQPVRFGGGMIKDVELKDSTYSDLPYRLEGGTPNYPGIIAFDEGLYYLEKIGLEKIYNREKQLMFYLEEQLSQIEHVCILGKPIKRVGILSFDIDGVNSFDLASLLDRYGIAVRSGNHCAQPAMKAFHKESVIRVSPAFYNTFKDIDRLVEAINIAIDFFKGKN